MDTFEFAIEDDMFVLLPHGEITSRSYPEIERIITDNISCGVKTIIAVMDRVDFIEQSGFLFC